MARRPSGICGSWTAALIDKRDDRGRTIDVHALRHTFGTHLSKGGVAPRTAQAAMRHSTLELTMNTYTDPRLLDVAGALQVLPDLPLTVSKPEAMLKTGTETVPRTIQEPAGDVAKAAVQSQCAPPQPSSDTFQTCATALLDIQPGQLAVVCAAVCRRGRSVIHIRRQWNAEKVGFPTSA